MRENLVGRRFGNLVVEAVGEGPEQARRKRSYWLCRCDCGGMNTVLAANLKAGHVASCGCFLRDGTKRGNYRHGLHGQAIYATWHGMLSRCYNLKDPSYPRYGGRGIKVCERWHDLLLFVADLGERPAGLTLGRIDNDGDYAPGNVRWESLTQQANNRRSSRLATLRGVTKTHAQWCRELGIKPPTLCQRLKRGWTVEEAFGVHPRMT